MKCYILILPAVALLLTGCVTSEIGRLVGPAIPEEYRGTFENVFDMLQDEQLFTEVDFLVETPDGRKYQIEEIKIVARPREAAWPLTQVPPGVMRRISKQPLPPDAEAQRQILADALKAIPSTTEPKDPR